MLNHAAPGYAGAIGLHPVVSRITSGVAMATNWSQSDAEALVTSDSSDSSHSCAAFHTFFTLFISISFSLTSLGFDMF